MATETAVFAVRSAKPCFSWATCCLQVLTRDIGCCNAQRHMSHRKISFKLPIKVTSYFHLEYCRPILPLAVVATCIIIIIIIASVPLLERSCFHDAANVMRAVKCENIFIFRLHSSLA